MGGSHLVPFKTPNGDPNGDPQSHHAHAFPGTSRHIAWLADEGFIDVPKVRPNELSDKSKRDSLSKLITSTQAAYFLVQCIVRLAQGLHMTTLELAAFTIVFCSIWTNLSWWHKPSDFRQPLEIELKRPLDDIFNCISHYPEINSEWKQTPLDEIDDLTQSWDINVHPCLKSLITLTKIPDSYTKIKDPISIRWPVMRFGDSRLP